MKTAYYIKDWAGNILGTSRYAPFEFETFEDAEAYMYSEYPDDVEDLEIINHKEYQELKKRTMLA